MTTPKSAQVLPQSLPPRGLSRDQAAAYVGVSPNVFDDMVASGLMPPPKTIGHRRIYDRLAIDTAFAALPSRGGASHNPWDDTGDAQAS